MCFSAKVEYIEAASDLAAGAFIAAFRSFTARCDAPCHISQHQRHQLCTP